MVGPLNDVLLQTAIKEGLVRTIRLGALAIVGLLVMLSGCGSAQDGVVVVYTSVDQPQAEPVIRDFEAKTGLKVQALYDAEAAKTTGLVARLAAEASKPRADVFWSSEFAQTVQLKRSALLEAYDSPPASDIPGAYRDPERYWTGFGVRARVILVNNKLLAPDRFPRSIHDLLDPSLGESEVAIANPLFGTTATHAAALYAALGPDKAQAFFKGLQGRKARIVDGNSVVRDMVARGEVKAGLTDTDDANEAVAKGMPVTMIFPDQEGSGALGTLVVPNTVALVRGAPHRTAGKKFIDYVLGRAVEEKLVQSGFFQTSVREVSTGPGTSGGSGKLRAMNVKLDQVADQLPASATWLSEQFLR